VFTADAQASLKHIRQVHVSKCNLVKVHLCIIFGTDFSADDSVQSLLCFGVSYSKCTGLELDYLGLMSRRSFIQVQSKVSWWGFNIFCMGVNVHSSAPRLKHLIESGELDWYELISWNYVLMLIYLVTGFYTGLHNVLEGKRCVIYILKLSWWRNSVKSSWADSFIRWFKPADILEIDCKSIVRVLSLDLNDLSWLLAREAFLDSISEDEFSCNCFAGMRISWQL